MAKAFASAGDMEDKAVSFTEIGEGLYAFTAEGDPNSGVIIGDDSVMVIEAQATPRLARKVIEAKDTNSGCIEIWGDGEQTRSFCYIDDCLYGIDRIMHTDELIATPINLGSSEMVSINTLVDIVESGFIEIGIYRDFAPYSYENEAGEAAGLALAIPGYRSARGRDIQFDFTNQSSP